MSKRKQEVATDLFGHEAVVEDAGAVRDMRRIKPLAADVAAEVKLTERIRKDPFAHLPSTLRQSGMGAHKVRHFTESPAPRREKKAARRKKGKVA